MTAKQIYLAAALAGCAGLGFSVSEWRWQNRCVIQGVRFSAAVELMADANDCLIRNNLFLGGFGMVLPRPTL